LTWSMAPLIASSGRIVFSPALAIKARRWFQQASPCRRARNARSHGSSAGAIATIVLPLLRLCRLDCSPQAQRLVQPSQHQSRRTISARRGGVNWKMGTLRRGQPVVRPAKSAA
jgi:hypothetical protein